MLAWKKNKNLKYLLFPLAFFYWGVIYWRNLFYSMGFFISKKLPTKVISIGNITTGGTGKTPTVIFLTKTLSEKGIKCAILSRGYGRKTAGTQLVTDGRKPVSDWRNFGDEPSLMAKSLPGIPIVVDSKRHRGGMFLIENFKPEVIILDDAFQHRSIERDLDIVLINGKDKKTDHKLVPFGLLREPLSSLKRADVLIFTKINLMQPNDFLNKTIKSAGKPYFSSTLEAESPTLFDGKPLLIKKGIRIVALSALADTKGFITTLKQLDVEIVDHFDFVDHYSYRQSDIEKLAKHIKSLNVKAILTTEKDMIKLAPLDLLGIKIYSVKVSFCMDKNDTEKLLDLI